ncbi:guanine nucleotide-releasing factor 2 isoform X3 [Bradysia coprophila]|uniref:guanine nucleotide-releasing factor 2 isoform X3 n=1 Tax=Bradysia coprophila TaxID=38358 RepID=UPI00187D927E|nr:guanine nucleotide-releasing factor 2 isoform X3 [Bradysia coprophila]
MPQYDDTFLSNHADIERKGLKSYHPHKKNRKLFLSQHVPQLICHSIYELIEKYADDNSTSPQVSFTHKNSLRGTKLARRARSFKDDFLEKISQIRTPTNTLGRSHSPNSPRSKTAKHAIEDVKPIHDLNYHVRQVKHALTHFKDVISKKKLEMLPGNGTVVLESIANVHAALQTYTLNEHSSAIISATTQVYLSLGKLIKLCDEVLLSENEENCASLSNENVTEVVDLVDAAIINLVKLANEKISERDNHHQLTSTNSSNTLQRPTVDVASQRTSLPDISLTPRERDILEQTSAKTIRASHSTESILRDSSPPPKPPLPNRSSNPPPLPPKRKSQQKISQNDSDYGIDSSLLGCGLDRMSLRSKSPDDNSSLLSASSLDSALNHSREEEELRGLTMDQSYDDPNDEIEKVFSHKRSILSTDVTDSIGPALTVAEADFKNQRNSNESGFASMQSLRASLPSVSMHRISEQQVKSSKSSIINTESSTTKEKLVELMRSSQQQQNIVSMYTNSTNLQENFSFGKVSKQEFMHSEDNDMMVKESKSSINRTEVCSVQSDDSVFTSKIMSNSNNEEPPALPVKTRTRSTRKERHISQYDNVEELDSFSSAQLGRLNFPEMRHMQSKHQSLIEQRRVNHFDDNEQPPPLPVKKKHMFQSVAYSVMAYMEMFGNCSHSTHSTSEFLRHSMHTYNVTHHSSEHITNNHNITHSQTMSLSPLRKQTIIESVSTSPIDENPPALPPKRQRVNSNKTASIISTPPSSPKLALTDNNTSSHIRDSNLNTTNNKLNVDDRSIVTRNSDAAGQTVNTVKLDSKDKRKSDGDSNSYIQLYDGQTVKSLSNHTNDDDDEVVLRRNSPNKQQTNSAPLSPAPLKTTNSLIEELDISKYLVLKKEGEDGPDVKGGYVDALIVHASKVQKVNESAFGEAFITTFRTFISPLELIEKLIHRHTIFYCQINDQKQKAAKESFSLLVRVVNDLTAPDLTSHLLSMLNEFVYQLVCSGQLTMAKSLRIKILEKIDLLKKQKMQSLNASLPSRAIMTGLPTLIDLKSADIAEQMTLLDAELFAKIEIPEVLIWAQEQCEERSPNLTRFTEHFNKMSYWARSQILKQEDSKDREKHVIKFIKIMKHLRKINNFNSYLALLSALDSAPIRRLEWHRTITDGLKEYCALIDSSSSFRAYRQALAETNPPCIPYIGLVLQDLTFVHIGNQDFLSEGVINFSKRWQQHNIVVNMKRFKKGSSSYPFTKKERIIGFFDNFENYLDEDAMWQISENLKPRVSRKAIPN